MKIRLLSVTLLVLASFCVQAQYRLYESGMNAYKVQNYDRAIEDLNEFLSKWQHDRAHDHEIYYALGVSYFKKEDYLNAMKSLDGVARVNKNYQKGSVSWLLAICCDRLNQPREAISEYNNAIGEYSSDARNKAKLLTERAKIEIRIGAAGTAKDDLTQALAFDPGNSEAKILLDKFAEEAIVSVRATKVQPNATKNVDQNKPVRNTEEKKPEEKKPELAVTTVVTPPKIEDQPVKKAEEPVMKVEETARNVEEPVKQAPQPEVKKEPTLADIYADEKRYALVIGNSSYPPSMGLLPNPKNDATDIAEALKKEGFSVNLLIDATYGEMKKGIFDLKKTLDQSVRDKTVALFYYAGHGIQAMNENWLIPVDSKLVIKDEDDIRIQCVPVQTLLLNNLLYTNSRMNIIILDACRNNPIPAASRSAGGKGLAEVSRARGSWIAFATAPGSVASDGPGRNGLYTQELLKAMARPGLSIEEVFKEVRRNVYSQSGERQETWDNSNIIGDFYFNLNSK